MRTKLTAIILCCFSGMTLAQEAKQKYIDIEGGMDFVYSDMADMDYIRNDVPSYYYMYGEATKNLSSMSYKEYLGLKTKIYSINKKLGIWTGVRYTRLHGSIGKETYWSDSPNFFYLLYRQEGSTTEYLKVKEINQLSQYLGIPVEVQIFPFPVHWIQVHFKVGAEFSYRLHTKTDIVFNNEAMNSFENSVADMVGEPDSFYSTLYLGVGIRLGKPSKPNVTVAGTLPSAFLTEEKSGIIIPRAGAGFQLNVHIPF